MYTRGLGCAQAWRRESVLHGWNTLVPTVLKTADILVAAFSAISIMTAHTEMVERPRHDGHKREPAL